MTGVRRRFHRHSGLIALGALLAAVPMEAQVTDPRADSAQPASDGEVPVAAADWVRIIDELHFGMDAPAALVRSRQSLGVFPDEAQLLHRAARQAVHAGMLEEAADRRDEAKLLFYEAEGYAEAALAADTTDPDAWSWLAIATGRRSGLEGTLTRIELASVLKDAADRALALDSAQSGALHVLGTWHAEVRRLNSVERFTARRLPGGEVFADAAWEEAERLLRRAVDAAPNEVVHRLELGRILLDLDRREEAVEALRTALGLEPLHPTDFIHLEAVRELLLKEGG